MEYDDTSMRDFDELLDSARAGREPAWETLYVNFASLVGRYLRSRNCPDPDDIVAETFFQVVRNLASFTGGRDDFRGWIVTIAHRRMVDEWRRRERQPLELVEFEVICEHAPAGNVEEDSLLALSSAQIRGALRDLSIDQQDVLTLRFLGGLKIHEVAEAVGKTPGAVKALQARGIAALRRQISPEAVS